MPGVNVDVENDFKCMTCPLAEHHILPFSSSQTHTNTPFALIHMDGHMGIISSAINY